MERRVFGTEKYPKPMGPYSQAIIAGDMIFVSGTGPQDPRIGKVVEDGIVEQTTQVLTNIKNILEDVGSSLDMVVKVTVFLADMNHYPKMNEVYHAFFPRDPPARTCVQAARLPGDILVEIEAIALFPRKSK